MPDPADLLTADEEARQLARRLADLSDLQREGLALRYGAGLTARQIGVVLGKSEDA